LEPALPATKHPSIAIDASAEATIASLLTSEPARARAKARVSTGKAAGASTSLESAKLVPVRFRLLSLRADGLNVTQELGQLLRAVANINTLVFAIVVDIMELAEHAQERYMGSRIVDNALGAVFNKELQEL
jgi:hypothetical protein